MVGLHAGRHAASRIRGRPVSQNVTQMLAVIRGRMTSFETNVESVATAQQRLEQKIDALLESVVALADKQDVQDIQSNLLIIKNTIGDPQPDA